MVSCMNAVHDEIVVRMRSQTLSRVSRECRRAGASNPVIQAAHHLVLLIQ